MSDASAPDDAGQRAGDALGIFPGEDTFLKSQRVAGLGGMGRPTFGLLCRSGFLHGRFGCFRRHHLGLRCVIWIGIRKDNADKR